MLILSVDCSSAALAAVLSAFKKIIGIIQIVGPILLIVSIALNIFKLLSNPDDKKIPKKILNSVIAAVLLFFIPMFLDLVMGLMGSNFSVSACWNSVSNFSSGSPSYISPYENNQRKTFISDSDLYEKGVKRETTPGGGTYNGEYIEGSAQQIGDVVWDSTNVTRISNLTSSQLIGILNAHGGKARNFIPYAQALITAEQKYQVNVFFLIGIEALESGWITSNIARNCNNLGGVRETSAHPSNGCSNGFGYYNSIPEFIDSHASMLHRNYLTPGARYYEGTSPYDVVKHYCPGSSTWPVSVIKIGNSLFSHTSQVI